jgi:hypothetical protein
MAGEIDLDRALERHLGILPPPRAHSGFASRPDAIELGSIGPRRTRGGGWS